MAGREVSPASAAAVNQDFRADTRRKVVAPIQFLEEIERLRAFLADLDTIPAGVNVLAVSHQDPILAARAVAGQDPGAVVGASIANCGLVTFDRRAGRWHEHDYCRLAGGLIGNES